MSVMEANRELVVKTMTCTKCGKKFKVAVPVGDKSIISPIIWMQHDKSLCDKCFATWYKDYTKDEEE